MAKLSKDVKRVVKARENDLVNYLNSFMGVKLPKILLLRQLQKLLVSHDIDLSKMTDNEYKLFEDKIKASFFGVSNG